MSIDFACGCGKRYSVKEEFAGKKSVCKQCGKPLIVPMASAGFYGKKPSLLAITNDKIARDADRSRPEPRTWRDFLYLLLLAAMIPLGMYTFTTREADGVRLERTAEQYSPKVSSYIAEIRDQYDIDGPLPNIVPVIMPDEYYQDLPNDRIDGALLARDTLSHLVIAILSGAGFLILIIFLFGRGIARPLHLVAVGLFTSTIGLLLFFGLQLLADATRGWIVVGGIVTVPFWILKFIASSYDLASDPHANLFLSAFGFTISAGMLEEGIKALPVVWHTCVRGTLGWRGSCLWGLASGAMFGVAEGIMYSSQYYNGISSSGIYLVRFISCVALHAVWTGSVGIIVYLKRKDFARVGHWWGYFNAILSVIVLSMLLHGLYDTFLKKDHDALALLTALASFVVLALQIEHMRKLEIRRPAVALA